MAAGDIQFFGPTSTAAGSSLALQPGAAVEVIVHNFSYGGAMELYFTDGVNSILVDADATGGSRMNVNLHCSNAKYYSIKNVASGAQYLAADGYTTK
jgi:hypothetical protein